MGVPPTQSDGPELEKLTRSSRRARADGQGANSGPGNQHYAKGCGTSGLVYGSGLNAKKTPLAGLQVAGATNPCLSPP